MSARPVEGEPDQSEDVELRMMSLSDILTFRKWMDDEEIVRLAFGVRELTPEVKRVADQFKGTFFKGYFRFRSIRYRGETVGFVNYMLIPSSEGTVARIGIVIGRKDLWGKGIGPRALEKLLDHLFRKEQVKVVQLDTADFNLRAQKAFRKVGFREIARDERRGKIYMELTREEYMSPRRS